MSAIPAIGLGWNLQRLLPVLVLLGAVLALFHETAAAMVGIWIRSETYAHAFLVPPITLWLVWRRRAELASHTPRAAPWLLLPVAGACLLWLLGSLAGINSATQFALVAVLVLSVPALFGTAVALEILFPLLFLFFAVPIGEFMVPTMMEWTADFVVAAVAASGVPVYREGLQFVIPSGNWSVVEACSGVRYLIASFMVGSLFAYLNYRSNMRRMVFMLVSILIPILANWLRAYMIVMLGHLSGNKLAVGADHLVYGWAFFGIIVMLMFMIGARWAEREAPAPTGPAAGPAAGAAVSPGTAGQTWVVTLGVLSLLVATQASLWRLDRSLSAPPPVMSLPATLEPGWQAEASALADWKPAYQSASAVAQKSYRAGDTRIGVWVGYYRDQGYERKLVTSTNMLVAQDSLEWLVMNTGTTTLAGASPSPRARTASLRQPANPQVEARARLDVAYLYWVGGRYVTSDVWAKLYLALDRLLGRGDDAAVLVFYTPYLDNGRSAKALSEFVAQQLAPLGSALAATAAAGQLP